MDYIIVQKEERLPDGAPLYIVVLAAKGIPDEICSFQSRKPITALSIGSHVSLPELVAVHE